MIDVRLHGARGAFVLNAVFSVPADGITVVRGSSGSGKTSLLRAIAGLEHMIGHVRINSEPWQDGKVFVPPHRRHAGYVFQEASLFAHLDVRGNLDYARKRAPASADFDGVVADLDIARLLDRSVHDLSGGERQRVAVARALMATPKLLLMDEPLSSLDRAARDGILPLIRRLGQKLPVLYVTHDPTEAKALADRVLRMDNGQVTPENLSNGLEGLSQVEIERLALAALRSGLSPRPE
ncbi:MULTISPECIES: ATP-binding cassette domain-containing protein [Asticcacaulis]|uniref:ATP-binding cassette domain-containing protein n=1 Tax=Asticcacaulis TaxID=76890 RepID=UPI001AEA5800|nr:MULTISPECIES: ATP-binding cassette domain-containing protein [Asticcacaulis]MBP2161703.1 molybdate transport system ATP-binding protein [Asticcacaulis solisilvae]MDR6802785.1 molybdate transport system ATP-binding protein [Asticcacaulis sp. BE141]